MSWEREKAAGMTSALQDFALVVGGPDAGPVTCRGGGTQWGLGGAADPDARVVAAPSGVVAHEPGEMIVRVRASTTIDELQAATRSKGQLVAIEADRPAEATIGGVLSCGQSGIRRLGRGPIRDAVLEVTAVAASGRVVRAGAPLVKNVTGFDLCKLLVGSYGTLAFVAEVVLRCIPEPQTERWFMAAGVDPFDIRSRLYKPLSVLWDGHRTWVCLAGYDVDVAEQARSVLGAHFSDVDGPPQPTDEGTSQIRMSMAARDLRRLSKLAVPVEGPAGAMAGATAGATADGWLAEVGVGVVHCATPGVAAAVAKLAAHAATVAATAAATASPTGMSGTVPYRGDPHGSLLELHRRIKENFDPTGRLNPGRSPLGIPSKATRPGGSK